jgi:hypothetical protein
MMYKATFSALDGGEWLASGSDSFTSRERAPVPTVHRLGGPKSWSRDVQK